jgi:hypothetical protein
MKTSTGGSHPTDGDIPRGYSMVDVVVKIGLFSLSGLILYSGVSDAVPISFYNSIILSLIMGFLLLSFIGVSVGEIWAEVSKD